MFNMLSDSNIIIISIAIERFPRQESSPVWRYARGVSCPWRVLSEQEGRGVPLSWSWPRAEGSALSWSCPGWGNGAVVGGRGYPCPGPGQGEEGYPFMWPDWGTLPPLARTKDWVPPGKEPGTRDHGVPSSPPRTSCAGGNKKRAGNCGHGTKQIPELLLQNHNCFFFFWFLVLGITNIFVVLDLKIQG